jgi:hypothetical protein
MDIGFFVFWKKNRFLTDLTTLYLVDAAFCLLAARLPPIGNFRGIYALSTGIKTNSFGIRRPALTIAQACRSRSFSSFLPLESLPPGVLEELQRRNPENDKGNSEGKHHEFLTPDLGIPDYRTIFLRLRNSWKQLRHGTGFIGPCSEHFRGLIAI